MRVLQFYVLSLSLLYLDCAEFQDFLRHTERELRKLFNSIDKQQNGHLDKTELRKAFSAAGMNVDRIKLDQFFEQLDTDNDGVITFEEWRCVSSIYT